MDVKIKEHLGNRGKYYLAITSPVFEGIQTHLRDMPYDEALEWKMQLELIHELGVSEVKNAIRKALKNEPD